MAEGGSITRWVRDLQAGDGAAAGRLWESFFHRMRGPGPPPRLHDEEEVALSAFARKARPTRSAPTDG